MIADDYRRAEQSLGTIKTTYTKNDKDGASSEIMLASLAAASGSKKLAN